MPEFEERFSSHDGLLLHLRRWVPEGPPRGAVVVIHGICEHGGRYAELAAALVEQSLAVYRMDLRGHGLSEGERIFVLRFEEYLADIELLLARVEQDLPGVPVFLFGHSMGGSVALRLAIQRNAALRGLVVSAPAVRIRDSFYPLLRRIAPLVSRLFPRLRFVKMGIGDMSHDPQVIEDFQTDPLVYHGRMPTRTGTEILETCRQIESRAAELDVPLLVLHGTQDRITVPDGSRWLHETARSADKTLILYKEHYHDLLHETEKARVLADIVGWIVERSG